MKERVRISSNLQRIQHVLFIHHTSLKHTRVGLRCDMTTTWTDVL